MYGVKLGFIGTGNMGRALIKAFAESKIRPRNIYAYNRSPHKLKQLQKLGISTVKDNQELIKKADIIFICVKPSQMKELVADIKGCNKLVVSIAAGIKLSYLEKHFPKAMRVMPNVAVQAGQIAAAYTAGSKITQKQKLFIEKIFGNVGVIVEVEERYMSSITALSGSGPAFYAYMVYSFMKAATQAGVNQDVAKKMAVQTCIGAGMLMKDISPGELIAMVASPGGTTEAGLDVLKKKQFEKLIADSFRAARDRAQELSKQKNWNPSYIR